MSTPIAQEFLAAAIDTARRDNTSRLPPIGALARASKVSRMTMWKAVHALAARGVLSVKHGSGIYLSDPPGVPAESIPRSTGCRWEQVRARITSDILAGSLRTDSGLPSRKELAQRYGVHPRTLSTALSALETEGLIRREHSRYLIVRPPARLAGRSMLVLILPQDLITLMQWSYYTRAVQLFMSGLEHECHRRGIALVRRTYPEALHDVKLLRDSLGCIFWVGGNEPEADEFFKALPLVDRPLSIVDYWWRFSLPQQCINARNCLILTIDEQEAMVQLGRYALQQGHRRVAYFRCVDNQAWTDLRIAGIRAAFRSAGIDQKAITVYDSRPSITHRLSDEEEPAAIGSLHEQLQRTVHSRTIRENLTMRLNEARSYSEIECRTLSSFEEALKRSDIKAWICESNSLAVYGALTFLRERRIALAKRPSVLAFGDSPEAFCNGLTSVVQRMDLCLEEVLRHSLYPRLRGGSKEYRKIRVPNTVMVRET